MADNFNTLWNRLLLRCPSVGAALSQELIKDSFNQLAERRQWSWLMKSSAFYPSTLYNTGSVDVTPGLYTVTGTGTTFTAAMVGRQFRAGGVGGAYPTYTIAQFVSPTLILIDSPWIGPTLASQQFQIFTCYFTVPEDFNYFYSLINPTNNLQLWTNVTEFQLDCCDAQRSVSGPSLGAAFYDYTRSFQGTISSVLQVRGTGATPVSTTSTGYSFPASSTYSIEITTGGGSGTAIFQWKQDSGSYTTGVTTDSNPLDLSNGVQVYFPAGTYVLGDTFIINCTSQTITGVSRYELWPRPISVPYVYPYQYVARIPELTEASPQLPDFIARRGDVILEMAMAAGARFPGGSQESPNPYYDLSLADRHELRANKMIFELETQDDNVAMKDLKYANLGFGGAPWMDGSYLASHAWPYPSW